MSAADDLEAIRQLKARYFRLMDTKQWQAWGELFTDDAILAASPDASQVLRGREAIVDGVSGVLRDATTVHHGHMPEIELTGPDSARGIWAMYDYVDLPRLVMHGYGHYHEEYRREDGVWRIQSLKLTRLRVDTTPREAVQA